MDRLGQRVKVTTKALSAFEEILAKAKDDIVRDASIQRFEFTLEAVWKLGQLYLRENEGLTLGSPKSVFRACFDVDLIDEHQTKLAIEMVDDRNLSVHTYNEELAESIYSHLASYKVVMSHIVKEIRTRIAA